MQLFPASLTECINIYLCIYCILTCCSLGSVWGLHKLHCCDRGPDDVWIFESTEQPEENTFILVDGSTSPDSLSWFLMKNRFKMIASSRTLAPCRSIETVLDTRYCVILLTRVLNVTWLLTSLTASVMAREANWMTSSGKPTSSNNRNTWMNTHTHTHFGRCHTYKCQSWCLHIT